MRRLLGIEYPGYLFREPRVFKELSLSLLDNKKLKNLGRENLRDHMTDLELIFSMLGKASTTEIAVEHDAQGFVENQQAARAGGTIAGNARKELEEKSGRKVVSSSNFLNPAIDNKDDNE